MKRLLAVMMTVVLLAGLAACGQPALTDNTKSPQPETEAQTDASQKASAVYAAFLGQYPAISSEMSGSLYVADINADGYPEIIARPAVLDDGELYDGAMQFMATYTEQGGLSVIYPDAHSSMGVTFRVSEDNCLYYTDDGHNVGTASYHSGFVYSVDDMGFHLMGQAFGDDWPEDADLNDYASAGELDAEYDRIFADKIRSIVGERAFVDCTEVELPDDADAYLNEALDIDIAAARQSYADAEKDLGQAVANAAEKEPQSVFVSDYDRDGTYEAFAFVAETEADDEPVIGSAWFVNAQGEARQIQTDVTQTDAMGVLSCTYHDYFQAPLVGGSSVPTSLWQVQNGVCGKVELFDFSETELEIVTRSGSGYLPADTLISTLSAFDMSFSDEQALEETGEPFGVGHTHKPYFFRDTPEGIREYGGIEIRPSDIERLSGGKEILRLAQKDGRILESIYYRENGVISFSVSEQSEGETNYYCFNALYAQDALQLLHAEYLYRTDAEEDYLTEGFYAAAASPEHATFPKAFVQPDAAEA